MSQSTHALPLFVPRTVISSERAATQLAHRVMTPMRTAAARALAFADRVVSGWVGHTQTRATETTFASVSSQRAAVLGTMPVTRPWLQTDMHATFATRSPLWRAH